MHIAGKTNVNSLFLFISLFTFRRAGNKPNKFDQFEGLLFCFDHKRERMRAINECLNRLLAVQFTEQRHMGAPNVLRAAKIIPNPPTQSIYFTNSATTGSAEWITI